MTDASALIGSWRMISWTRESIATGEKINALGPDPIGYISYGADGRIYAIVIRRDRQPPASLPPSERDRLQLFDTMLAYSGTYTLHDDRVIHHIDASWNQLWTGTDQVRFYKLSDDRLSIWAPPTKDPYSGQDMLYRMEFERVRKQS